MLQRAIYQNFRQLIQKSMFLIQNRNSFRKGFIKNRIVLSAVIPMIFFFIFAIIVNSLAARMMERNLSKNFTVQISFASKQLDETFYSALTLLDIFSQNSDVQRLCIGNNISDADFRSLSRTICNDLNDLRKNGQCIDSIFIYLKDRNTVINQDGIFDASTFFSIVHPYEDHPKNFWDNLHLGAHTSKILNMSRIVTASIPESGGIQPPSSGYTRSVVPLIQQGIGSLPLSNVLVVVNFNTVKLSTSLSHDYSFDTSCLCISDENGNMFASNFSENTASIAKQILKMDDLESDHLQSRNINGKKYYIYIQSGAPTAFRPLHYIAFIESNQMMGGIHSTNILLVIMALLLLLIAIAITFKNINRMYIPFTMFLTQVDNYVNQIEPAANSQHGKTINTYAVNQFFAHLLMNKNYYTAESIASMVKILDIKLPYPKFYVILINYDLTSDFYNTFDIGIHNHLIHSLDSIFTSLIGGQMITVSIKISDLRLAIILNCSNETDSEDIVNMYNKFLTSIAVDRQYMNIQVAVSTERFSLDTLCSAYTEDCNTLMMSPPYGEKSVLRSSDINIYPHLYLPPKLEAQLYSTLSNGNDCTQIMEEIFKQNRTIPQPAFKSLCINIYSIALRVLESKNLTANELMRDKYVNLFLLVYELSPNTIWDYLLSLCEKITQKNSESLGKLHIDKILQYLYDNYTDSNLSLGTLADHFGVTDKYLSKFIKSNSGITFFDHLAKYRVEQAKILLKTTSNTLQDIFTKVGFNNRNTFLRTFKQYTGLSPTEFRKSTKMHP